MIVMIKKHCMNNREDIECNIYCMLIILVRKFLTTDGVEEGELNINI